jgi:small subunit ribosomal protein S6
MRKYELVFIIRQDVSASDIEKINLGIVELIQSLSGDVVKKESWGFRQLAYKIKGNTKGNYVFMVMNFAQNNLPEFERKIKLSSDIIRYNINRIEEIDEMPSPLLERHGYSQEKSFEKEVQSKVSVS